MCCARLWSGGWSRCFNRIDLLLFIKYNNVYIMSTSIKTGRINDAFWNSLFNADSIAVIGANNTQGSWGFDAFRSALNSIKTNPQRKVYAVNPNDKQIQGVTAYPSVLDIPGPLELAIIVVRADIVPSVFRQCAQKQVKAAVIISAGFAEVDTIGAELQAEIIKIARENEMHFVGPNCVGHADLHTLVASAVVVSSVNPGHLALITQSGTLGATIAQIASSRGLGMSKFISTGNEADLRFEDYLEYLARDDNTRIIAGYIEGLREGRRFFQLAKEITSRKPVIVIKTGTTEKSSQAARSHTGALAGSDKVYSAAFKQSGVIRVEDEEELCDVALSLLNQPLPRGNRIAILTIGGGFGVVMAEACEKEGLQVSTLEPVTIEKLNTILPPRWSHGNPVDLAGLKTMGNESVVSSCIRFLMEDNHVDIVISLLPPAVPPPQFGGNFSPEQVRNLQAEYQKHLRLWGQLVKQYHKPLILVKRFFSPLASESTMSESESGEIIIPEYTHPRRAARMLFHLVGYRRYLDYKRSESEQ